MSTIEKTIATIEILKIIQHVLWLISAFWLGYMIGQQKVCKDIIKKDMEKLKEKIEKFNDKHLTNN